VEHLQTICASVTVYKLHKVKILFRLFLALFSKKPFQVHYFYDAMVARKMQKKITDLQPDHIYCQLIRTTEYIKNLYQFPKTLDYMDAFSKGMLRRASNEGFLLRPFVRAEANRLTAYENIIFDYFDHHTIISEQDRDLVYHKNRKNIVIIPNGINTELLEPQPEVPKTFDLLFHGNLSYTPNIDCVKYIVNEIMPVLLQHYPNIKVAVSGATPHHKVVELCKKYPGHIKLLGFVPDIKKTYTSAKVFFAPLQIGTGLQNKILEAMALKVPCITSELCNNALKGTNGVHLLTAKNPNGYIKAIHDLLDHEDFARQIAQTGQAFVKQHFSWEEGNQMLLNLFKQSQQHVA
jgi:glycosyltransferase involved in cell wall biosynthesis